MGRNAYKLLSRHGVSSKYEPFDAVTDEPGDQAHYIFLGSFSLSACLLEPLVSPNTH